MFRVIRELVATGRSVIYISHRLDEVKAIGDRATVMRDGATVGVFDVATVTKDELVEAMIGRALALNPPQAPGPEGERAALLEIHRAAIAGVIDVSGITVERGQIIGLAGLGGAGRSTLLATLFGDRVAELDVSLAGSVITRLTPRGAVRAGIGLVPRTERARVVPGTVDPAQRRDRGVGRRSVST